jgi:hypothetical protein
MGDGLKSIYRRLADIHIRLFVAPVMSGKLPRIDPRPMNQFETLVELA